MDISTRITLLSILGNQLTSYFNNDTNSPFGKRLQNKIIETQQNNPWFTEENTNYCLTYWAKALTKNSLINWTDQYKKPFKNKKVGIIMAGNIPMVGFHDLISVFLSGHIALVKISSKDNILIPFLIQELKEIEPALNELIQFIEKLENYDAVIATGSDNTARYFEYYFKESPTIIRKNRTSIAVLNGNESKEQLVELSHDVFRYFGLGCRNVTKLFIPKGYDVKHIFEAFDHYNSVQNHHKYFNNYTYHKAIYLMNLDLILDNGFFMLKKDKAFFSPISCLFYEEYDNLKDLEQELFDKKDQIQALVTNATDFSKLPTINFGQTQNPNLYDYADGVDVMNFLEKI